MKISEICINKPVFATVMSLIILLVGIVSYEKLTVREYPNIDEPAVTITTTYPGTNAEIIESQVTKVIEDSIAGIEGVKKMSSTSREGTSIINVDFLLSRDPDAAAAEVRDRVSRVRGRLPDEIDEPIVAKVQADSQPIIWIVMQSEKYNATQLSDLADRLVKDQLQTLPGVADVTIFGMREYAMRVWIDPIRMAAHGVTANEVENAISSQNLEIPSGKVEGVQREFTVLSNTSLNTREDFENIIIANRSGHLIRVRDIGNVTLGVRDDRINFRYNGKTAVGLGIVKQAVANPLEISQAVRAALPKVKNSLPDEVNIQIGNDTSVFIDKSIENVFHTLVEAVVLVVAVILLFLLSFRASLIPLVTIPVSLVGTFAIMWALGFSINTLTMLAMVLAIGLVVDDAIVVLENIYRHVEDGKKPKLAARIGANEIGFAVLAMTVTLAAVYVPVSFMEGRTGKLFTEFALTLASAVLISGFVALTLSPMMCSLLLKKQHPTNPVTRGIENSINSLDRIYRSALGAFLKVRYFVFVILILIAVSITGVFSMLRSELSPIEDRGLINVRFLGPEGATTDYMTAYARQIEDIVKDIPEVFRYGVVSGIGSGRLPLSNQGISFIGFTPWKERSRKTTEIAAEMTPKLFDIPGIMAFAITPASLGAGNSSRPIEYILKSSTTFDKLSEYNDILLAELAKNPKLVGLDSDLKINTPQLKIEINRAKLADLGISVAELGRTLETLLAGRDVTRFKHDGEQYEVVVQLKEDLRMKPDQLNNIFVRAQSGDLVALSNLVTIEQTVAPRDLNHFDRTRAVKIQSSLAPGYSLGEALDYIDAAVERALPNSVQTDLDGQSREFRESSSGLYFAFILALLFIYLVLAAQYESFIDPIVILITVPLSMIGALLALWLTGNTLNIYSQIGLITLIGLITKHGILIVEFANKKQEEGLPPIEAVLEAAVLRLRPILMTTAAMVFGALPLAISSGAGAESRQQLGWVIVGGMTFGTLLTLFVLPAFYTFISRHKKPEVL